MAKVAAGSMRRLIYVAESDWGVTPTDPTMKTLRNTGGNGISVQRNAQESEEFRSDRAIADVRMGVQRVSLDVPFELSFASFDDMLEAALFGDWTADVLKQDVERHSFTIEEGFTDIDAYIPMVGAMVNSFSLNLQPEGQMVTGSFGLIGRRQGEVGATTMANTVTAANTNSPFDSFKGHIMKGSQPLGVMTSVEFTLNNNLEQLFALFEDQSFAIAVGRANLTGQFTAYFTGADEIDEFNNEEELSIELEMEDLEDNKYTVLIPRIKWTGNTRNLTENTITQQIPFQAMYDSTAETTIQITREEAAP